MKRKLMYVEQKNGFQHDGPAWIGWVTLSKTRKTVHTHGKNLERFAGGLANHFDTKNEDLYWVCNPRKDGSDRHPDGAGLVTIDADAIEEYQKLTGKRVDLEVMPLSRQRKSQRA